MNTLELRVSLSILFHVCLLCAVLSSCYSLSSHCLLFDCILSLTLLTTHFFISSLQLFLQLHEVSELI